MLRLLLAFAFAVGCHVCACFLPVPWFRDIPPVLMGEEPITVNLSASVAAETTTNVPAQGEKQREYQPPEEQNRPVESRKDKERNPLETEQVVREARQPILKNVERVVLKPQVGKRKLNRKQATVAAPEKIEHSAATQQEHTAIRKKTEGASHADPAQTTVEARPMYQKNPKPAYPMLARQRGWQGTVLLAVMVAADGVSEKVSIVKSSGFQILDKSALKAVKGWKFLPGMERGTPIAMEVMVPVNFVLE